MGSEEAVRLLREGIVEVAQSPTSMRKLARAAATRPNLEQEWVYEIDGATSLEGVPERDREVGIGGGRRADMRLAGTLVEFKSTKSGYARADRLWTASSSVKQTTEAWLGPDIDDMESRAGVFVLLVSTAGDVPAGDFAGMPLAVGHVKAVELYREWLVEFANQRRPGSAAVVHEHGGQGEYDGVAAVHDALIVSWES
jgi:hypothetical protein